jgi:hypothetical protein
MSLPARLTDKYQAQLKRRFEALAEAEELLGLINAEFVSDPRSVQCFDLRIVERVRVCVQELKNNFSMF